MTYKKVVDLNPSETEDCFAKTEITEHKNAFSGTS